MLQDKVVIITGGGSGIGRATAIECAQSGAMVVVADISDEGGQGTVSEIAAAGGQAAFIRTDVSSEEAVKAMVDFAVTTFGKLDGAFNNAGIEQQQQSISEMETASFDKVLGINLRGVFFCCKHEVAAMRATGGGAIVNVSSVSGERGIPNTADYTAAKHGVIGLTRAVAAEARDTLVRANAVLPGLILTPMVAHLAATEEFRAFNAKNATEERHSVGRFGQPEDVARAVRWLLSDESTFINGVALPVDGGYLAR